MADTLPHIFVEKKPTSLPYIIKGGGQGEIPIRDSAAIHGTHLLEQFQAIQAFIKNENLTNSPGLILEFDLVNSGNEPLNSLDNTQFKLLSTRAISDFIRAEVYISQKNLSKLENKINKYLEEQDKPKPKNQKLINHINEFRPATLESLWGDDISDFPKTDNAHWWEIWLRYDSDADPKKVFNLFIEEAKKIGLEIYESEKYSTYVIFPERIVTNIKANKEGLRKAIRLLPQYFAEIRLPYSLSSFIYRIGRKEAEGWLNNIKDRVLVKDFSNSPAVCLLDTGVNHEHPLLKLVFDEQAIFSITSCNTQTDKDGHGTLMAGLAAYGDLSQYFHHDNTIEQNHHLESVKIIKFVEDGSDEDDSAENPGAILETAVNIVEQNNQHKIRHYSLTVTNDEKRTYGLPTVTSAVIDKLSFNARNQKRLFIVCAGNIKQDKWHITKDPYSRDDIHDPGQAWNALTVGAYAHTDQFKPEDYPGFNLISKYRDLSPSSTTSINWNDYTIYGLWPYKPDIVFPGGNAVADDKNRVDIPDEMNIISTSKNFHLHNHFDYCGDTSAAATQAARMAAQISAQYPNLWPETVRALMVHSANWSDEMKAQFSDKDKTEKENIKNLLRYCGYGIPSLNIALNSLKNRLTLIFQQELQPFYRPDKNEPPKFKEMNLHELPWPKEVLRQLGNVRITMRVTLSYFIDPNPSKQIKTHQRYSYESYGLRFALKHHTERVQDFTVRISKYEQDVDEGTSVSEPKGWKIGTNGRTLGSVHSDIITGYASDLASCDHIVVYPTTGWWKLLKKKEQWKNKARYALIVTIETEEQSIDLYTPVKVQLEVPIEITT